MSSTSSSPECNATTTVKRVSCQLPCEQTVVSGFAIKRYFLDFCFGTRAILRWLHTVIIYCVAHASVMFWMLVLHSFLHPVLSNLLHVISNDDSVLLSSLLKSWLLVLNYNPIKCIFTVFIALFLIFLNFLRWNLPRFNSHIASNPLNADFKHKKLGLARNEIARKPGNPNVKQNGMWKKKNSNICPVDILRVGSRWSTRARGIDAPLHQTTSHRIALLFTACACNSKMTLLKGYCFLTSDS